MRVRVWLKDRSTPGTLADLARRILDSDQKYKETESTLRKMYVLEAVVKNGGDQVKAAEQLGISRMTVQRVLRSLGMMSQDVHAVAKHLQESANESGIASS